MKTEQQPSTGTMIEVFKDLGEGIGVLRTRVYIPGEHTAEEMSIAQQAAKRTVAELSLIPTNPSELVAHQSSGVAYADYVTQWQADMNSVLSGNS